MRSSSTGNRKFSYLMKEDFPRSDEKIEQRVPLFSSVLMVVNTKIAQSFDNKTAKKYPRGQKT